MGSKEQQVYLYRAIRCDNVAEIHLMEFSILKPDYLSSLEDQCAQETRLDHNISFCRAVAASDI